MNLKLCSVAAIGLVVGLVHALVAIHSDGASPEAFTMLEVTSTSSGVLIPLMTVTQREAIPSHYRRAEGLGDG